MSFDPGAPLELPAKLLLHADDLGATGGVSDGILRAWMLGHLDGFSIMANGEALDTVQDCLATHGDRPARIAVHLNLSEGPCVAPAAQVPLLVDANGNLRWSFGALAAATLLAGPKLRARLLRQIEIEWRAQIRAVARRVAPRGVTAVDGHIHVHMLPALFPIAARLASEERIPEIRVSREAFYLERGVRTMASARFWVNALKHAILRGCARLADRHAAKFGLAAPQRVVGVLHSGGMTASAALQGLRAAARAGGASAEVIFHVGQADSSEVARWGIASVARFNLSGDRAAEWGQLALLHRQLRASGRR